MHTHIETNTSYLRTVPGGTKKLQDYFNMETVPHKMVELKRMVDYRGVEILYRGFTVHSTY